MFLLAYGRSTCGELASRVDTKVSHDDIVECESPTKKPGILMPGFFCIQASVVVVIVAAVVTMVAIVAMTIGAVVVAAGATVAMIADDATAE